ncbi:BGTF surface domain-containing protein [Haladaptatus pallidirubidus]|uniref:PGF-CTERM archaeal protein-sorting signal domain-containing protein n=1 Tax=Haladaptatus pallidirubidus TaxID=1008152 RepID=A0AAV3UEU2_9EURY|nr:BGTF surface domain-containing protein [Haladaptatus pallidirubidus]
MMSHNYVSAVLTALVVISLFSGTTTATSVTTSLVDRSVGATSDVPFDHSTTEANNSSVSLDTGGDGFAFDAAANQTVRGQTSFDPDTELLVQIHARGQFFKSQTVSVQPNGSFAALFNFSGYDPGIEFGVVVATPESNETAATPLAVSDGVLRAGPASTTTTETLSTIMEPTTETATTADDAGTKTETDAESEVGTESEAAAESEVETTTEMTADDAAKQTATKTMEASDSSGQPGFGLIAAVVAVAGIAVLSRRR